MTNNQTKCGIIYEKFVMWVGDDEQVIMSGLRWHLYLYCKHHLAQANDMRHSD